MEFMWDKDLVRFIISLVAILAVYGLLTFILIKVARRRVTFFFLGISLFLFLLGFVLRLDYLCILVAFISAAGLAACFFANLGDVRKFIANPFSRVTAKAANFGIEKIYDSQQLFKNVESAVISLSNARIGAIITF